MPITALFALPLALLYFALSFRVIGRRRAERVEIGDGNDRELLRRVRVHANAAEYIPLGLITMGLAEGLAAPPWLLVAAGTVLLAGRLSHAYGLSQSPHNMRLRVAGMAMTFTAISISALTAFGLAAWTFLS
ncbi:MAG: MAPEG family protein [Hyphomicrobiaceae bacterium]|nr:MAPEG family protein [Hyphomicrobiaceae bacterium]